MENGLLSTLNLTKDQVPLRTGPPTLQELILYYPPKFTWEELKTFINSGWVCLFYYLSAEPICIQYLEILDF